MNVHFIKSKEKKELIQELEKFYGITELPYLLIETGKKKIRAFSGSFTKEDMLELAKITNVEVIGMYIISKKDEDARISFDSLSILKKHITKNIIEIEESQLNQWIRGHDLDIPKQKGVIVLKHKDDLVGVGKSNGEKIFNYVPKERKIKTPMPK